MNTHPARQARRPKPRPRPTQQPQARSRPPPAADSEEATPSETDPTSTRSQRASPRLLEGGRTGTPRLLEGGRTGTGTENREPRTARSGSQPFHTELRLTCRVWSRLTKQTAETVPVLYGSSHGFVYRMCVIRARVRRSSKSHRHTFTFTFTHTFTPPVCARAPRVCPVCGPGSRPPGVFSYFGYRLYRVCVF